MHLEIQTKMHPQIWIRDVSQYFDLEMCFQIWMRNLSKNLDQKYPLKFGLEKCFGI